MREFVSAGGELMIHAALHLKNSPNPEVVSFMILKISSFFITDSRHKAKETLRSADKSIQVSIRN